ncbi:hypothetical protein H4R35_004775 [Dimargaris xerosporica]|nr:hypothetical protein H4R35_004775 [Dimargaris xerosporica]
MVDSTDQAAMMDIGDQEVLQSISHTIADYRQHLLISPPAPPRESTAGSNEPLVGKALGILVLDTNYLISQLAYLKRLVQVLQQWPQQPLYLIVPWAVIQELDGLKDSKRWTLQSRPNPPSASTRDRSAKGRGMEASQHSSGTPQAQSIGSPAAVSTLARAAITFIHDSLAAATDQADSKRSIPLVVRGQQVTEYLCVQQHSDDAILDCCRYFQSQRNVAHIGLLSMDKNLAVKAMVHGIQTFGAQRDVAPDQFVQTLLKSNHSADLPHLRHLPPSDGQPSSEVNPSSFAGDWDGMMVDDDGYGEESSAAHWVASTPPPPSPPLLADANPSRSLAELFDGMTRVMEAVEDPTHSPVVFALIYQCFRALGSDWQCLTDAFRAQPWSVRDMCDLIQRYWYTVFREVYPAPAFIRLQSLKQQFDVWQELRMRGFGSTTLASRSSGAASGLANGCSYLSTIAQLERTINPRAAPWKRPVGSLEAFDDHSLAGNLFAPTTLDTFLDNLKVLFIACDDTRKQVETEAATGASPLPLSKPWAAQVHAMFASPTIAELNSSATLVRQCRTMLFGR